MRDPDPAEQQCAGGERDRVRPERDAGAAERDERAADRRPEDAEHVPRQPLQGIRLLQARWADRLWDETHLGRDDHSRPGAVHRLQRDDDAERRAAREDQSRRRGLRRALQQRRGHEHELAGQPVRQDAAEDEHDRKHRLADAEHDAEIRRRAEIEHRERQRDACELVTRRRDRGAGEEQPELALTERSEALAQRSPHQPAASTRGGMAPA